MSKLTIGVIAGAALASVAALSPLAASGSSTTSPGATVNAASTAAGSTASGSVKVAAAAVAVKAATTTKKVTPVPTKTTPLPRVLKVTRSVTLNLPTAGKVGSTVTGFIQVTDSNTQVTSPVAGIEVVLQKKVAGAKDYVTVVDDVTDGSGQVNVSFAVRANTTWRAAIVPAKGTPQYSKTVLTTASAQLTWATRPDLEITRGVPSPYGFRVSPVLVGQAHLEYALSTAPTKWIPLKNVPIPATGLVTQSLNFAKAGTYLVRGATAASSSNGAGYTTVLSVVVS